MLEGMWRNWYPYTLLIAMLNGSAALENSWKFLRMFNIALLYDPKIPLPDL